MSDDLSSPNSAAHGGVGHRQDNDDDDDVDQNKSGSISASTTSKKRKCGKTDTESEDAKMNSTVHTEDNTCSNSNQTRPNCRVFISYSHKDEVYRERLEKHSNHSKRMDTLNAGWHGACHSHHYKKCQFAMLHQINHWQALPSNALPVKQWKDPDEAWMNIEQGIIEAIRNPARENLVGTIITLVDTPVSAIKSLQRRESHSRRYHRESLMSSITPAGLASLEMETPLELDRLTEFWKAVDLDDARGKFEQAEVTINSMLSFTAAQMVWSLDFPSHSLKYFGLYQGIVRNSIPLFVTDDYYQKVLKKQFHEMGSTFDADVVGRAKIWPKDFTSLFNAKLMGTRLVTPRITGQDRPVYGIVIGEDEDTGIASPRITPYLDGDIWCALKVNGITSFYSRFCNIADDQDESYLISDLQNEIQKLPSYEVVFQFDQKLTPFKGKQAVEVKDLYETFFDF
ncbi:expressed unknown protein [Seminavis robusta]|uniref:TIR domain-containing protein n=1 Tax=Seminavis robusta TaxID=568900 RepID=A0A9N8D763_9STRA|nr:expressed unknown protein [Seminavis robusta]|eukprot:Sro25_g017050.1 n/a (455) ;mRNA; r:101128-102758